MTKETNRLVKFAIIKGVAHGSIIPLAVMILTNIAFSGRWGIVVALVYLLIPMGMYKMYNDKAVGKIAFYYTLKSIFFFVFATMGIFALMVMA